ncbi:FKBP-type peptidyl-prolyl cis-trans isomerase [Polaribacter cellanae]|uniref:Peptidyl-prolyl cis-trans isomerase n=1 Tax=Polaribacter cellanae TaxID=2818493 RepID=A0A975H688_9FLAO|nr:FKBP-type peptidyl-prolyl cis-trans isomerase [Polaribacter cellanae]QTE22187.1 FKBP-type peptidyl-prolyl cis-trans isomerase [Polaribacter cellanae]
MKSYIPLFLSIFLFVSCSSKETFEAQTEADIIAYVKANNLNAKKTNSGLYYVINKEGSGKRPQSSRSNVTVAYKGYFLDGKVFDENAAGYKTDLNRVILGWTEGIQLFREGGEGVLIVPYQLGYGANGRGSVPGGAVLVFDIKLISVN